MTSSTSGTRLLLAGIAAFLLLPGAVHDAAAQSSGTRAAGHADGKDTPTRRQQAAIKRLNDSVGVVNAMSALPRMPELLQKARGIYIVPTYGRAALGIGAEGGSGVLMVRKSDGSWGNPAFFNIGGLSVGLQAGAEGGPIALLLLNDKAVENFRSKNNFALSADAGLTVVNYSRLAEGMVSGDVVAWSSNKGLFGNVATLAINDIRYNQRLTDAYYGKTMTAQQAIDSTEMNPQAEALRKVLRSPPTPAGAGKR